MPIALLIIIRKTVNILIWIGKPSYYDCVIIIIMVMLMLGNLCHVQKKISPCLYQQDNAHYLCVVKKLLLAMSSPQTVIKSTRALFY